MEKFYSTFAIDRENGGIISINKPLGMTSFHVVHLVRKWTNFEKVGHAGTLDPMATGVLLLCLGRATKQVSKLMEWEKTYIGTIKLGTSTETDDSEGEVLFRHKVDDFSTEMIIETLEKFCGRIHQTPPMYSAIKKDGKRLYKLARKGIHIQREPREVHVHRIDLLEWNNPKLTIQITCSKGTYVRALARDIGNHLGTGAFLSSLKRIRIGPHKLEEACSLEAIESMCHADECISV